MQTVNINKTVCQHLRNLERTRSMKNVKNFMAARGLAKSGITNGKVEPIPTESMSRGELIEAIGYLDHTDSHYRKNCDELIWELGRKEVSYPVYGFFAGVFATTAAFLLFFAFGYGNKGECGESVNVESVSGNSASCTDYPLCREAVNVFVCGVEFDSPPQDTTYNDFFFERQPRYSSSKIFHAVSFVNPPLNKIRPLFNDFQDFIKHVTNFPPSRFVVNPTISQIWEGQKRGSLI